MINHLTEQDLELEKKQQQKALAGLKTITDKLPYLQLFDEVINIDESIDTDIVTDAAKR